MSKIKETIPERANFHDDSPEYEPSDSECRRIDAGWDKVAKAFFVDTSPESLWQKVAKVVNTTPKKGE